MLTENSNTENREREELNREPDRMDRSIDTRERDDFYDTDFDYDNFDYNNFDPRKLNLLAPPPRTDERLGKMRQHWAAFKHNNHRRVQQLEALGYRKRHPDTVPSSFKNLTEQWEGGDVIMVGGECLLMEVPESHYNKLQRKKYDHNNSIMRGIKESHGKITRVENGETFELRDNMVSPFFSETNVARENPEGINFAD